MDALTHSLKKHQKSVVSMKCPVGQNARALASHLADHSLSPGHSIVYLSLNLHSKMKSSCLSE